MCVLVCVAEVQCRQASLVQLQEEVEQQRAQLEQMELDKDSQLISLREELLSQTQQLDSCQARVSTYTQSQKRTCSICSYMVHTVLMQQAELVSCLGFEVQPNARQQSFVSADY